MHEAGDALVRRKAKRSRTRRSKAYHSVSQDVAKPRAFAALTRFMQTAPAELDCSHSGILTCGRARETTATTSGARPDDPARSQPWRRPHPADLPERHGDRFADAPPRLAFEDDEAPGGKVAMIGNPGGEPQQGGELSRVRPRARREARRARRNGGSRGDRWSRSSVLQGRSEKKERRLRDRGDAGLRKYRDRPVLAVVGDFMAWVKTVMESVILKR